MTRPPAGARLLVVGVDGLDYDLVRSLDVEAFPRLRGLVDVSEAHASVFPPDSVPSWTTIVTGLPPQEHGQLSNVKFMLETASESSVSADLNHLAPRCFWEAAKGPDIAVINPFLAFPPWAPQGTGAMVSGPPFAEELPSVADPRGLLVGEPPARMGGFSSVPERRAIDAFCDATLRIGQEQYDYALLQLQSRRWDVFFFTSLVVDRVEHYAWRFFDAADATYAMSSGSAGTAVLEAHQQLERFLTAAERTLGADDQLVLLSDHGHASRASVGVNLHELLRRHGLHDVDASSTGVKQQSVEFMKTLVYSLGTRLRLEDLLLRLVRRLPNKRALKSGSYVGSPTPASVTVPDLAGSNPFGGLHFTDPAVGAAATQLLLDLRYKGRPVVKWIRPAEQVLGGVDENGLYPRLLFELYPEFGPTWNLYGPLFSPILTRRRQSGGHTRRGVAAGSPTLPWAPSDSKDLNTLLLALVSA